MKVKLLDSPLAQLSDGTLIANITHIDGNVRDVYAAAEAAIKTGRRVFVGVERL